LIADLTGAFHSEEFGGEQDSMNFRPERFLDFEGKVNSLSKRIISFGVGKRSCPGNRFAEISFSLFLLSIIQQFKLSLLPGDEKPSTELEAGITFRPQPFRIRIQKRVVN
jgi:cytochrome P450